MLIICICVYLFILLSITHARKGFVSYASSVRMESPASSPTAVNNVGMGVVLSACQSECGNLGRPKISPRSSPKCSEVVSSLRLIRNVSAVINLSVAPCNYEAFILLPAALLAVS